MSDERFPRGAKVTAKETEDWFKSINNRTDRSRLMAVLAELIDELYSRLGE